MKTVKLSNEFSRDDQVVVAVVIPCYKVKQQILNLIQGIGDEVSRIYVVDDACPDFSGKHVETFCKDGRVNVIYNKCNLGVGGAVMSGYRRAIAEGAEIIVKLDGDGQMDPSLIRHFINPILSCEADYTKGNRFFDLEEIRSMPKVRIFGNAVLSFMTKLSSGYWDLFDPTNGYTAIHADVAIHIPFDKVSQRYFFESDMLFRLNTLRAVVVDIPMSAIYKNEVSSLKVSNVIVEFLIKHARNFAKRLFYNYYLRDVSLASIELPLGCFMIFFGLIFGGLNWIESLHSNHSTPAGTVMLSALPVLMGTQLVLAFLAYDISSVPKQSKYSRLRSKELSKASTKKRL